MIPDAVSNTAIGQMRMQFWRDAIKSIFEVRLQVILRKLSEMQNHVGTTISTTSTPHRNSSG